MTTAIQNEEDLIILWDETSSDTSMIDFDFPAQNSQIQEETSDFIIDFEDSTKNEVTTDFVLDDKSSEVKSDEISFGEDIFWVTEKSTWEVSVEKAEVSQVESSEIDFWFATPEVKEIKIPSQREKTSFDRNSILDEAIAKMQSRKSAIAQTKSSRQSTSDELNEQIKLLKSQVSDLEKEIKELDKETGILDGDIMSIEKMKTSVLEVTQERARKHNLSNIKK